LTGLYRRCNVLHMPATKRQQQTDSTKFRDAAILAFAKQCLKELGSKGAMGCASLAVDWADELLAKRNEPSPRNGK
jgi:hypothetical protein